MECKSACASASSFSFFFFPLLFPRKFLLRSDSFIMTKEMYVYLFLLFFFFQQENRLRIEFIRCT